MMIDFHTHVLPGIDDGSQDEETTRAMLAEEARQGVSLVVATPHFYANRVSMDGFLKRREAAMARTARILEDASGSLPRLMCGAEVYYFRGIGNADAIAKLCVEGTNTLLLEMPFEQWTEGVLRDVEQLIEKRRLDVVLAHVERYPEFQRDDAVWERVMALSLTRQINAGSFMKAGGLFHRDKKRKFCMEVLRDHPQSIIGTDCHNMRSRLPNLAPARSEIEKELGGDALAQIDAATRRLLNL